MRSEIALSLSALALTAGLMGCDRGNTEVFAGAANHVPTTIDIGEVQVLTDDEFDELRDSDNLYDWCKETDDEGRRRCYFGQVSSTYGEYRGGATLTFKGTGDDVCIMSDPETVFWSSYVGRPELNEDGEDPNFEKRYRDNLLDDGDIDVYAGLSSYYTGSPGIEIGDFKGFYTDSKGRQVELEYGLCLRGGSGIADSSFNTAQAGRGAPEWCTFSTAEREGVEYTAVLEAYSVPIDDGALAFSAFVLEGDCEQVQDECAILGEALIAPTVEEVESDSYVESTVSCSTKMEVAYCNTRMTTFCCLNPEMCGDEPEDSAICREILQDRDSYCDGDDGDFLCCDD